MKQHQNNQMEVCAHTNCHEAQLTEAQVVNLSGQVVRTQNSHMHAQAFMQAGQKGSRASSCRQPR